MLLPLALAALAAPQDPPRTVPERTDHARTSTTEDVARFLDALVDLPAAGRLRRSVLGHTTEGRPIELVVAAEPLPESERDLLASGKLRILVNANIHGGEVEGKEVVQMLLRELALGDHAELLEHAVLLFVPVYNADGNDAIARTNRVSQNGPEGGVGERANAQGLDLNRDFVKVESPECEALLGIFRRLDPHVFMDLHTTNGSTHGYALTYSPSLSPNVDPRIDAFARTRLLPAIRTAMRDDHGFEVFDYGNFRGRPSGEAPRRWATYDHRPRFGTNYYGLRGRFSILSEAYSYSPFAERIASTRAFVLESIRAVVAERAEVRRLCARADVLLSSGTSAVDWGVDASLVEGHRAPVLVSSVEEVEVDLGDGETGTRRVAAEESEPEEMLVQDAFEAGRTFRLPTAWAIAEPSLEVLARLEAHGVTMHRVRAPTRVAVERFEVTGARAGRRPFQGHFELSLEGTWRAEVLELPRDALVVRARQRLGRVAAELLDPESDDSLTTWNFFDAELGVGGDAGAQGAVGRRHPVARLGSLGELPLLPW